MENQRIRLSKQLLKNALITILKEKNITKISVRELCDTADINRTTFYKYYGSQYDVLSDIENDFFFQIENTISIKNNEIEKDFEATALIHLLTYVSQNIDLCKVLINSNVNKDFSERLFSYPAIKYSIYNVLSKSSLSDTEKDYVYEFILNGVLSIFISWINKNERESIPQMAEFILKIIFNQIGAYI